MSAFYQTCDCCGQTCCVTYSSMPIHPLHCVTCFDESYADPEDDFDEDEELLDEAGGGGR